MSSEFATTKLATTELARSSSTRPSEVASVGPFASLRPLLRTALPPTVVVLALLLIWQLIHLATAAGDPDATGPGDLLALLGALWSSGHLVEAVATSLGRGGLGFLIAIAIATPLGLLLAEVSFLRRGVAPLITALQVLPSVAWVPAAIIWFGVTDATIYFVVLTGAIPSIVTGLLSGVDQVPPPLRRVGRTLGASRAQMAFHIVLPAALPGYLGGIKQGWAFAWRALMAAEIIGASGALGFGLGSLLQDGRAADDVAAVLAAVIVILLVGVVIEVLAFGPLERAVLRRRGLTGTARS